MPTIQFVFDYASPFSYLADQIRPSILPGVEVDYHPMYLRGVPAFAAGLPYEPAKAMYLMRDMHRCFARHDVPFRFPSTFPVNGLYALRGALWTMREGGFALYHQAMWRAVFVDDRPVHDRAVVADVAAQVGIERAAFLAGIEEPAIKDDLKQRTAAELARGVFGHPMIFVGDEPFWGHDRLDYVARAVGV